MSDNYGWSEHDGPTPRDAVYLDPPPVKGDRLPNGNISCHGCGCEIPDNSGQGLKPSCPNCWAAVDVIVQPAAPSTDAPSAPSDDWRWWLKGAV